MGNERRRVDFLFQLLRFALLFVAVTAVQIAKLLALILWFCIVFLNESVMDLERGQSEYPNME